MLVLLSWTACAVRCTAQDRHCIPLTESRRLHADALRSYVQDSVIVELSGKIGVLEAENARVYRDLTGLIEVERAVSESQKVISGTWEKLSESRERENKELRKKNRVLKWQRNGAVALGLLVIFMTLK